MLYLNLFLLTLIIIFIIDLSGFMSSLKRLISKLLTKNIITDQFRIKPFDCSLCMTHWIGLIYLICQNQFSILNYSFVCLMAFLTIPFSDLLVGIKLRLQKLFNAI